MNLIELFCQVDDFFLVFEPLWQQTLLQAGDRQRIKRCRLGLSEVMTIIIHFHQSAFRHFKAYYLNYVHKHLRDYFPNLLSYNRFVEKMAQAIIPLCVYLHQRRGQNTGIAFIDSTPIRVCHNLRIPRHKVFHNSAQRGKSSTGWFYGFKLHLIVNDRGELMAFKVSAGNTDDRMPVFDLCEHITGKLYGDKGYISKEKAAQLKALYNVELITRARKNMKPVELSGFDKAMLRGRAMIETVNDQLKNISQIEHSRHRSEKNFMVNLVAGLTAYSH